MSDKDVAAPLLSALREPPVRGRTYMVPVIDYTYCGVPGVWPVLGPLHHDRGDIGFVHLHFHVDLRFVSADQARAMRRFYGRRHSTEMVAAAAPLCNLAIPIPPRAMLTPLRCRVGSWKYTTPSLPRWMRAFDARYGKIATPIRRRDGRLLCPHRKVDLSSLRREADGTVVCPLHGLRVQCGDAP